MTDDPTGPDQESNPSEDEAPKPRRSWRGPWLWVAGVAILATGATVYAVPVLDRLEEQSTEIAESTAELEVLVAENSELQERLDSLNTPAELERLARERLGYVREGETAFVVISPPVENTDPSGDEQVGETEIVADDPWFMRWWSYISGSDLSADS